MEEIRRTSSGNGDSKPASNRELNISTGEAFMPPSCNVFQNGATRTSSVTLLLAKLESMPAKP